MPVKQPRLKEDETGVSKRNIEKLLRELGHWKPPEYEAYQELSRQLEHLDAKLLDVPERRRLNEKLDKAWQVQREKEVEIQATVRKLQRDYQVRGLTQEVLERVQALVDLVNSTDNPAPVQIRRGR